MNTIEKRKRVKELLTEVNNLKNQISNEERSCKHEYGETFYDPIEKPNFVTVGHDNHGVHHWPITEQQGTIQEDQWSRICKHCGYSQQTTQTKVTKTEPNFR